MVIPLPLENNPEPTPPLLFLSTGGCVCEDCGTADWGEQTWNSRLGNLCLTEEAPESQHGGDGGGDGG